MVQFSVGDERKNGQFLTYHPTRKISDEKDFMMPDETKPDLPATTEDEANTVLDVVTENTVGTEIDTVVDLVSSLSLPTWIARNASKAFRQLCSAAVEWPAAFFKGKAAKRQAITSSRVKIIESITDQTVQQLEVDSEYAHRAVKKYGQKIIGEQINLDKTVAIAADELKNGEPDNSINQGTSEPNREQSAGSTDQDTNGGEEKVIDDDWLNSFETEARQKSTEDIQHRFGRVLAGEIRKPGSYSIKTVKTLGEMDQNAATLFKKLCSACVVLGIQDNEHVIDARVPSLDGNAGSNALKKYGLGFDQLNILNEYDLIISDYNSWRDYNLCILNPKNPILLPFRYQGKQWILLPSPERDNKPEFKLSGVAFSRVGRELFHIVDQEPMKQYTEDLKKFFAGQNLQMVETPNPGPIILKG